MRSVFRGFMLALPLAGTVTCEEPRSPGSLVYRNAQEAFNDLLNALPDDSIHAALNTLTKFKDGVFESDRRGVQRVHNENPPLATKLIVAAVQDLRKRQNPAPAPSNGTEPATTPTDSITDTSETPSLTPSDTPTVDSSSESPSSSPSDSVNTPSNTPSNTPTPTPSRQPSSSSPPVQSSRDSAVVVPVPITKTDENGQPTVVSSTILSDATASIAIPVTNTNDRGETVVSEVTKPAVIFTATDSAGRPFVTTSAVDFQPTKGQVLTRVNSKGSTFLTTFTPAAGRVSKIVLITTTDSDGRPNVVTSYTYVEPAAATQTNGDSPGGGSTPAPSLQPNVASSNNKAMGAALAGGAMFGVFALFF